MGGEDSADSDTGRAVGGDSGLYRADTGHWHGCQLITNIYHIQDTRTALDRELNTAELKTFHDVLFNYK